MGCTYSKTGVGLFRGIKLLLELRKMDPSKVKILNEVESARDSARITEPKEVVGLSKQLHHKLLKLKGKFLQDDGKVKYSSLRESPDFEEFKKECGRLNYVDLTPLNERERKSFFINIYNTLTTHALAHNVTNETTVLQLEKFWQMYAYKIGDFVFSLDDVEHGILRRNQLHPTYKEYFFKEGDPRREFVQSELDPRIHFALNCGARSCPPINLYTEDNLDNALDAAARNFCQGDILIDVEKKQITASKILMWYGGDFGSDEKSILQRITSYLTTEQQADFKTIQNDFKIVFSEYDWSIH